MITWDETKRRINLAKHSIDFMHSEHTGKPSAADLERLKKLF